MNLRNGIKKLNEERKWVEAVMLVEEVGLVGVGGLGGPVVAISGKKHNRQSLLCWVLFCW